MVQIDTKLLEQVDAFLKLEGIKGEARDKKHAGEIEVRKWEWKLENTGSAHFGGGAGAGKCQVGDIKILKLVDLSSPILMKACTTGQHIAKGVMIQRKAGGSTALEYVKIELSEILVSSIRPVSADNVPLLLEEVELNFSKFKITYTPQDEKGAGGASVDFGYDIQKNEVA
jgi:type VI secretion system secreted protein Hcp